MAAMPGVMDRRGGYDGVDPAIVRLTGRERFTVGKGCRVNGWFSTG